MSKRQAWMVVVACSLGWNLRGLLDWLVDRAEKPTRVHVALNGPDIDKDDVVRTLRKYQRTRGIA